ncbi:MAG: PIG-L family deacetylase [Calditrichaeota bacterium]|nr:PIG-L family deacetylase [Calditrichota bacterium]
MRILAIFAHPDDESYGPGGTLAKYAREGHEVFLLTFTRGEAGTLGICKNMAPDEKARMRRQELLCAARVLGIRDVQVLTYPDGQLNTISYAEGESVVMKEIDRVRPDTVITFHDRGISGHPDHVVVARWCRNAVRQRDADIRLFYFGLSPQQASRIPNRQLFPIPPSDITHAISVKEYLPFKIKAIHCHQSQLELWQMLQSVEGGYVHNAEVEYFMQVWPPPAYGAVAVDLQE